jgi:lipopolysaccharide/colanic/teichoic acid biosynthesis glycosyltransferase
MYAVLKRILDLCVAVPGVLFLAAITLPVGLAIQLTSYGPVFFHQTRVGKNGRRFRLHKFRTMVLDAALTQEQLDQLNETTGPTFKIKADPRVTGVGRFLRKFSLDEVPQFWNVLKGDMSIVGPRPPLVHEVMSYGPRELRRLTVPQGLTGLWQVSGRSQLKFHQMINLDLAYLERLSIWLDLKILLLTVPTVLRGKGAY